MAKLKRSDVLGRIIRQDDAEGLAVPTWDLVREAVNANRPDEAFALLDYGCRETKALHDSLCGFVNSLLAHAGKADEEEVYTIVRARFEPAARAWLMETPGLVETLQRALEFQRGHGGSCSVVEEEERFVVTCDPCGSGGQLCRTKGIALVRDSHLWTWGKHGMPYYCVHCCVMWEQLPIELRGYPLRINVIGEKPGDPCVHLYYKRPEQIPGEYFTRIGMSKPRG